MLSAVTGNEVTNLPRKLPLQRNGAVFSDTPQAFRRPEGALSE
jgi:hypothetical protein